MTESELLKELENRVRLLDRDYAKDPKLIKQILENLDKNGPSEIADVIHSLLWHNCILNNRANRLAEELILLKQS